MWLALIFVGAVATVARWSSQPLCPLRFIRQRSTCQLRRLRAWDAWHHGLRNGFDMIWPTSTGVLQKLRYLGVDSASCWPFQPINHHWRNFHFNKANTSGLFFDLTLCFMLLPHHSPWPWSSHPSFAGCGSAICCRSYMQWSNYSTNQPSINRFYAIQVGLTDIHGYSWLYRYTVLHPLYPWNHHVELETFFWEKPNSTMIMFCANLRGCTWESSDHVPNRSNLIAEVSASFGRRLTALPVHAGLEGKWTWCVLRGKTIYLLADNQDLSRIYEPLNTIMRANLHQLQPATVSLGGHRSGGRKCPVQDVLMGIP